MTRAPALLDEAALARWLDARGLETGRPMTTEPLSGGRSNVMHLIGRGSSRWVLRRPANVAIERANDGMRREFRLLTALDGSQVPHPAAVALCDDHDVLGCTFYLMEHVHGTAPFPAPPAFHDDGHRAQIAYAMVDALARLHDVDWRAAGLDDLGSPDGFHRRQVSRWSAQLASYRQRSMPGMDRVTAWLTANVPGSHQVSLMHGDYHMLNTLIDPQPPGRVVAILDWETATLGDPLLDLAGFCEIWCPVAGDGWPDREALVARYGAARGIDPPGDLTYYNVLYNFRLAVLLEGIYQRSLRDPARPDQHEMGRLALTQLGRATDLLDAS